MQETTEETSFRMDYLFVPTDFDQTTGRATFRVDFDPRRYEWLEHEGKRCLLDKLDNLLFEEDFLFEQMQHLVGMDVGYEPPMIDNSNEYIQSRLEVIKNQLDGTATPTTIVEKSDNFLQSLAIDELEFVILSVDLVGSTNLSTTTEPRIYNRIVRTLSSEMGRIVPKFNGHILKHTGDGLLAYFPAPSFITKNDLAIDCALTLRQLIYQGLNPLLKYQKLLSLDVRIGLDSGNAYVETIGDPETKQDKDIIGAVVNLAAKIQAQASPGEVLIGNTTLRYLHTGWRTLTEPVMPNAGWNYLDKNGKPYQLHRIKISSEW